MEKKKHDLRDEVRAKTTVTNTDSHMAGGDDKPQTVKSHSGLHELTPDKPIAEGQVTKSS
jgi:hypothetical protein